MSKTLPLTKRLATSFLRGVFRHYRRVSLSKYLSTAPTLYKEMDLGGMRKPYKGAGDTMDVDNLVSKEPFANFEHWFKLACETPGIHEANAMSLATATKNGRPSVRVVLMKGFDKNGFKFFTNYCSRKAQEIEENPQVSLQFFWDCLMRMVRIDGKIEKLPAEESTQYFQSRPKDSQIGSCVSFQSRAIAGRHVLEERRIELEKRYADVDKLPRPEYWGGYLVSPESIEFWQGQTNRIHDRILFRRPSPDEVIDPSVTHEGEDGWVYERLSP